MNAKEIWMLPAEQRLSAFLERYLELDEMTGNRTLQEKDEMAEIADAVLPVMIRFVAQVRGLAQKWEPLARSTQEEMKAFSEGQRGPVQIAVTYGACCAQLQMALNELEGKPRHAEAS
jgi:hypothetical protein